MLGIDDFALRRGWSTRRSSSTPRPAAASMSWKDAPPMSCRNGSARTPASRLSPVTARGLRGGSPLRAAGRGAVRRPLALVASAGRGRRRRKSQPTPPAGRKEGTPLQEGRRAETTLERWQQVHDLRSQGVGLLDCSRRLGLALNTVKRYDRAEEPERLRRAAQYRPTLVDPYRDYLHKRRIRGTRGPGAAAAAGDPRARLPGQLQPPGPLPQPGPRRRPRPHIAPRKAAQILLTRPDNLTDAQRETAGRLSSHARR